MGITLRIDHNGVNKVSFVHDATGNLLQALEDGQLRFVSKDNFDSDPASFRFTFIRVDNDAKLGTLPCNTKPQAR